MYWRRILGGGCALGCGRELGRWLIQQLHEFPATLAIALTGSVDCVELVASVDLSDAPRSIHALCNGRRVQLSTNLYAKNATFTFVALG